MHAGEISKASLIAQLVKNPPAMWETMVQFLVQFLAGEDSLEKGRATHSSILAWRIGLYSPWDCKESEATGVIFTFTLSLSHQYLTIHILLAIKITKRYLSLDLFSFLSNNRKKDANSKYRALSCPSLSPTE